MKHLRALLFVATVLCTADHARAHGEPIIVTATGDVLSTNGLRFTSEFEPLGPFTYTNIPGFEFHGFHPGEVVTFDVVDHLWYWNAAADGVVPAAEELELHIEGIDPPFPATAVRHNPAHIDGANVFQPGFVLETIDGQSTQHQHLLNYLFESPQIPDGGYAIMLRVNVSGYESTPPFMIAFNQNLSAAVFQNALADLNAAAFFEPELFPPGDFNHDRLVDALDIDLLYAHRGTAELDSYDLNGDAAIDDLDAQVWVEEIVQTAFGDVNLDRAIDLFDLNAVRNHFGAAGGWAAGDSDGSGTVDLADLNHVRNQFGFASVTAVPEPSSLGISIAAAACLFVAAQQRRSRSRLFAAPRPRVVRLGL